MANSKTASKKSSKKSSKKTSKPKRERKLKVFCGATQPVPKGHRIGSMKECLENKQVRYYGLKKIDSKLVESLNNKKTKKDELLSEILTMKGKLERIKKNIEISKTASEKKKLIDDFQTIRKNLLLLNEKLQKMK